MHRCGAVCKCRRDEVVAVCGEAFHRYEQAACGAFAGIAADAADLAVRGAVEDGGVSAFYDVFESHFDFFTEFLQ